MVEISACVELRNSTGIPSSVLLMKFENPLGPSVKLESMFMPKRLAMKDSGKNTAATMVILKTLRSCANWKWSRRIFWLSSIVAWSFSSSSARSSRSFCKASSSLWKDSHAQRNPSDCRIHCVKRPKTSKSCRIPQYAILQQSSRCSENRNLLMDGLRRPRTCYRMLLANPRIIESRSLLTIRPLSS